MSGKILRSALPLLVPIAALGVVTSGMLDREDTTARNVSKAPVEAARVEPPAPAPVAQAPTAAVVALTETVAAAQAAPVEDDPAPQSTAAQVVAMVEAATSAETPQVSRDAPLSTGLLTEPVTEAAAPLAGEDAAAFFASAQANLAAQNACGDDLKALAADARIYFPSGGLAGEDAGLSQARLIGLVARDCPGYTIQVEGHSDPSGDPQINLRLSQQRAEAVIARLAASGIDTSAFVATGYGDQRPSNVRGPQPDAYYDRRVEFSVVPVAQNVSFATNAAPAAWESSNLGCAAQLETVASATRIYFGPGSITASASDMESAFDIAAQTARCGEARLRIVGHHADGPSSREDVGTGRLRALAVMSSLVAAGFEADQLLIGAPSRSISIPGNPGLPNSRVEFQVIVDESQG